MGFHTFFVELLRKRHVRLPLPEAACWSGFCARLVENRQPARVKEVFFQFHGTAKMCCVNFCCGPASSVAGDNVEQALSVNRDDGIDGF